MKALLHRLLKRPETAPSLSYVESRELARHPDAGVRQRLAERTDIRPEILYFLAEDTAPEVRRRIATNDAAPAHANVLLAADADDRVRCELAQKIGRLLPGLNQDERDRIRQLTLDALDMLARDQLARVRQVLSEAIKDSPHVPRDVARRLARDVELAVCSPMLEHSPQLSDSDLMELIASPVVAGAMGAIARREGLSGDLSAAIADSGEVDAVAALLANPSAQIREETLDRLVDGAARRTHWQMPLARHPRLPVRAVRKLAGFVAESVLAVLSGRSDLDPETVEQLGAQVRKRIAAAAKGDERDERDEDDEKARDRPTTDDGAMAARRRDGAETARLIQVVHRLYASGELTAGLIADELAKGNRAFVSHALALKAGLPPSVVGRIASSGSAKAMTALSWKAGLDMGFATRLQAQFAQIPAGEILQPRDGTGYPLSEEDMKWQLDVFAG